MLKLPFKKVPFYGKFARKKGTGGFIHANLAPMRNYYLPGFFVTSS
jgi:hypothetical protein